MIAFELPPLPYAYNALEPYVFQKTLEFHHDKHHSTYVSTLNTSIKDDDDALIDDLAKRGIAYTPYFPLGGFTPLQSSTLASVAKSLGATTMQVALAWLLQCSPDILLIPGTSSVEHLRENLKAADLQLPPQLIADLDAISTAKV